LYCLIVVWSLYQQSSWLALYPISPRCACRARSVSGHWHETNSSGPWANMVPFHIMKVRLVMSTRAEHSRPPFPSPVPRTPPRSIRDNISLADLPGLLSVAGHDKLECARKTKIPKLDL
jgi:hypothetical protein